MNSNHRMDSAVARVSKVAARLKPAARTTSAAAGRGIKTTRAWAAPQLERTGQLVENRIAPGISSMLSSAARRIEPGKQQRRRWRTVAGASMVTAAASAVAGAVLSRRRQNGTDPGTEQNGDQQDVAPDGAAPGTEQS